MSLKIITYNVNGIRSAVSKGFADWLKATDADIVCLQEIKAASEQIPVELFEELGYAHYWFPAQKKGYSGVGILSRQQPKHVEYGCGISIYDAEGRVIRADYENFSVMSVYMPSGTTGDVRQDFKMQWLSDFRSYIASLKKDFPNLIVSGDYNICHKPIDIHNPVSNKNSSGFLPEERAWIDDFLSDGFVDTFRFFNKEPYQYSWWSFRANARAKNLGWRIDYHMATESMVPALQAAQLLPMAHHSDHCPVLLQINNK